MKSKLHIVEPVAMGLITDVFDLRDALKGPETWSHECMNCGHQMRYPRSVRREDLEEVKLLIKILEDFAKESGASDWALSKVMAECYTAIAAKNSKQGK